MYNPITGSFIWTGLRKGTKLNKKAGTINRNGYRIITIYGRKYQSGRLAWLYMKGEWPENEIDHCNRNRTDDRWKNLRLATTQQNLRNRIVNKKSGLPKWVRRGVKDGRYQAVIKIDGKVRCFGTFDSPEEAYTVVSQYAKSVYGDFYCDF